ncbi:putative Sulfotransferase [Vibrio chagasii]|nr:putative Sulfotransferase [Vibrio chagasii]CAH6797779.1 putative Sulfotransferase [Vibrio chagasii]CAH7178741.1 putative Sulfotransferase [Vibrio chagasii]CAH7409208.1 putative Sulfotransferase [Vibrio chagasii]
MSRRSLIVRIAKLVSNSNLSWLSHVDKKLAPLDDQGSTPIIFIIGLPRSGTTLTYQAITNAFKTNYLSNLSHFLYQLPNVAIKLSNKIGLSNYHNYSSNQGFVSGINGQAEGLHFWNRWQGVGVDEDEVIFNRKNNEYLSSIIRDNASFNQPYVACYLGHIFCINELVESYPRAIFVEVCRDSNSVKQSLLKCRETTGEKEDWFSLKPTGYEDVSQLDASDQVDWQLKELKSRIQGLDNFTNRTFKVDYLELCCNPNQVMREFKEFAISQGYYLEDLNRLPNKFERKKS